MTKFEYVQFTLGRLPTPAGKYTQIQEDIYNEKRKTFWNRDRKLIAMLKSVKHDIEMKHSSDQLTFANEEVELEYWAKRLAKQSAIELLTIGKLDTETLMRVSCLDDKHFVTCVRDTTILATELNLVVQDAEKSVNSADIVPIDMMK
tara:strand:- start:1906 stop:2346 length:441 start_codon:yes stop_codon:yes gene_type:complete